MKYKSLSPGFRKAGDSPTCVFLHGFLGTSADWACTASQLPWRCLGFDLPGHGSSPFSPDFCSAFAFATEHLPPFHLIGYSMGGRLALQFAIQFPQKVLSLHLLSAHLGLKTQEERRQRFIKDEALAKEILKISVDEFLHRWYDQPLFKTLISKMDIRSMRKEQNREGLSQAMEAFSLGRQRDVSSVLPVNTHLYAGEFDETYRANYRGIAYTVIKDAGHAVHLENPIAVAHLLQEAIQLCDCSALFLLAFLTSNVHIPI